MIIMDRTRRLRMNATLRDMVRENHVRVDELIYPVFVTEGNDVIAGSAINAGNMSVFA